MSTEVDAAVRIIDAALRPEIEEACAHLLGSIREARDKGNDLRVEHLSEKLNDRLAEWRDAG